MKENFYYIELYEIYKSLLTEKQKEIFEMHFVLDLSLSEIAEEKGITRQNVSDTIKNAKVKLEEFELSLRVKEKNDALLKVVDNVKDEKIKDSIKEIIGR